MDDKALKLAEELSETTIKLKETELKVCGLQDENNRLNDEIKVREKEIVDLDTKSKNEIDRLTNEIFSIKNNLAPIPIIMEENRPDTAIVIITYNNSQLIKKQIECIRWFCKDVADIIIVDNSTDGDTIAAIKYYNDTELHCKYLKTDATSKNGSDSHSFSANLAYLKFKDDYKFFMCLDFDCFPVKPFSIKEMLGGKIMAGMGQRKGDLEYFWPGCMMWDNEQIDRNLVNFATNHELKLDTGGLMFRVIEKYGKEKCPFFNEIHVQNPNFTKTMYNFYAEINDGMFMHFINSSNWNPTEGHQERMNSLLNLLEEKITKPTNP